MLKIIRFLRLRLLILINKTGLLKIQKKKLDLHEYWVNPKDNQNMPFHYEAGAERSNYLLKLIAGLGLMKNSSILEIGCNTGRNLNALFQNGYNNLNAIEISSNAINNFKKVYPKTYDSSNILIGPVEDRIHELTFSSVDLVFTMAVLEHIHDEVSDKLFSEISRITKTHLITIEDELGFSIRNFPRNYKEIFEKHNMTQLKEEVIGNSHTTDLGTGFIIRVFEKQNSPEL